MNSQQQSSRLDYGLMLILLMLFVVSCVAIYSAQTTGQYDTNFVIRQIVWYVVGVMIIALIIRFDSDQLHGMAWYLYGFGIFLLIFLIVAPSSIAPTINGAKNWFVLPGIGSIQPSEFMKVFLVLTLSRVMVNHHAKNPIKTMQSDWVLLLKLGGITAVPLMLVVRQDLGTSLVMISILLGLIFVSGITWKILLPLFGSAGALIAFVFYMVLWQPAVLEKYLGVRQYQFDRIYSWLDPYNYESTIGFHLTRSLLAIGSGQTMGKGFGYREVYLPESHTDFIFSVIGEEYGFIGASIVVSLFFVLIYHITKLSLNTKIPYYSYVCAGVIAMITFHAFQNIGMTIGLLPITGIPLPFISYGGSAMMGNMMAIALIFSITFNERHYMFSSDQP